MGTIQIKRAEGYLNKTFDPINCEFKFFEDGNATILSTSFGVQIGYLLNVLDSYPTGKICKNIKSQQSRKTGLFVDKNYVAQEVQGFEEEYLLWQYTYFATIALDMLRTKLSYPLNFLDPFKDLDFLENWLKKQGIKNFWYTSNKIMFLLFFYIYEQERMDRDNRAAINYIFNYLDRWQDPDTGFWGTQSGAPLDHAMYGAAHIYLYYDYCGRKIKYPEKIIGNVLRLQNPSGLFGSKLGGACEDYNGIEILTTVSKASNCNFKIMDENIRTTHDTIAKNQRHDGGFSYYLDNRGIYERIRDTILNRQYHYKYSGWNRMKSNGLKSDLWGTYFRLLTLAKIKNALKLDDSSAFRFSSLPGWGY